jgi:hypothetical protein
MAATQIIPNADPEWCGNTATNCAPSKPVDSWEPLSRATQFDETGFPLLDPADVTKWCYPRIGGDLSGCIGMVQEVYDIAKYEWQITFESSHPDDTQIALKEAAQLVAHSGGRDNVYAYYVSLRSCLQAHLKWHRLTDQREFRP